VEGVYGTCFMWGEWMERAMLLDVKRLGARQVQEYTLTP
jgi:hypothetical protein